MSDIPYPHFPVFRAGQGVVLEVAITDGSAPGADAPAQAIEPALDPDGGVTITITSGPTRAVTGTTDAVMTRVMAGRYRFEHQTATTDPTTVYSAEVIAFHGSLGQRSQFYGIFRLVA